MKKILRSAIFISIFYVASSCYPGKYLSNAKSVILPLSDSSAMREGTIVYGLPLTVLSVTVDFVRTIEKPGPYARYANDLLGLSDVIINEDETWSIEGIAVKSAEELDPSQLYMIYSSTLFQSNVLHLKKEGIILDINPGIYALDEKKEITGKNEDAKSCVFDLGSDEYYQLLRDTAYKRMNVDSLFVRIPYIVEKKKKLGVDQLAEKAAKRLLELRDGKHLILTGEANVFPQSDAAINEINRMEKAYTELFTGKSLKKSFSLSFKLIPQKSMIGNPVTLFRFSEKTGPDCENISNGKPVTIELIPEMKTKKLTVVNRHNAAGDSEKFERLYYRVPDIVGINVNIGSEKLFDSRRLIFQFGEVMQLPANYIIGK